MVKPILTVTYYSRRHRSVQSTAMDCTDCPGGLYSPPEETVAETIRVGLAIRRKRLNQWYSITKYRIPLFFYIKQSFFCNRLVDKT